MRGLVRVRAFARRLACAAGLIATAVCGCVESEDEADRLSLQGDVVYDGKPLESGRIFFRSEGGSAEGAVTAGKFSIPRGSGARPGHYTVAVTALTAASQPSKDAAPGRIEHKKAVDPIPSKYNVKSTLHADVKSGERNEFKFDLAK